MIFFRHQYTNYYLLPSDDGRSLLAFDAGWPCSLHGYARAMKQTGFRFGQIRWAMVSHFHLDHAGLVRDFQDEGIQCLLFEGQAGGIDGMERTIAPKYPAYRMIRQDGFFGLATSGSRTFLASIGIDGEVIPTPGHSDDSVSLVTDAGEALIGDLYPVSQVMDDDVKSNRSWKMIRTLGVRRVFPGHAGPFGLE